MAVKARTISVVVAVLSLVYLFSPIGRHARLGISRMEIHKSVAERFDCVFLLPEGCSPPPTLAWPKHPPPITQVPPLVTGDERLQKSASSNLSYFSRKSAAGCDKDGECSIGALVRRYKQQNTVVATFGNWRQRHFTENWVAHLQEAGVGGLLVGMMNMRRPNTYVNH